MFITLELVTERFASFDELLHNYECDFQTRLNTHVIVFLPLNSLPLNRDKKNFEIYMDLFPRLDLTSCLNKVRFHKLFLQISLKVS